MAQNDDYTGYTVCKQHISYTLSESFWGVIQVRISLYTSMAHYVIMQYIHTGYTVCKQHIPYTLSQSFWGDIQVQIPLYVPVCDYTVYTIKVDPEEVSQCICQPIRCMHMKFLFTWYKSELHRVCKSTTHYRSLSFFFLFNYSNTITNSILIRLTILSPPDVKDTLSNYRRCERYSL